MKILHLIPSISPVRGGPSQAIVEMVQALRSQGIDAEIATTNDDGEHLLEVPLCQRTCYQQVPTWFFPRYSPSTHVVREFAFSGALTTWLWRSLQQYDLLHVHAIFSYPSTAAMVIARCKNVPYLIRPLGQLCEWSLHQSQLKKQIYLTLVERSNLRQSCGLHCTSVAEQQEVDRLQLQVPTFLLPHGVSLPAVVPDARLHLRQQLNLPPDEPLILFLSRLHAKKGLDYLIPALSQIQAHRFTLVLAGSGSPEYEAEVDRLLEQHGLKDRTHRSGFVTGAVKNLLLQGADLFVLPSHSENFGVAVLEAMAAGLPVVVTPGVALADLVKQLQVGYVTELEIDAIAQTIAHCLSNQPTIQQMGKQARQWVAQQYTWEQNAAHLIKTYQSILHQYR
jgi:glycosyltransferase involved in cell wall biosynthesis